MPPNCRPKPRCPSAQCTPTAGLFDEALSSFFRNVDARVEPPLDLPVGDGRGKIQMLKARAVVVDMEEGVVNELLKASKARHAVQLVSLRPIPYAFSPTGSAGGHV